MDFYSLKKTKTTGWGQKDMGKKLVSKLDVISSSRVLYPYVSKHFLPQLTKPSATKILLINQPILF